MAVKQQLPHAFYGAVTIDGEPAPVGTVVTAMAQSAIVPAPGNPLVLTMVGFAGTRNPFTAKIVVQGAIERDTAVYFWVNGLPATVTYTIPASYVGVGHSGPTTVEGASYPFRSGEVTEVTLAVETAVP